MAAAFTTSSTLPVTTTTTGDDLSRINAHLFLSGIQPSQNLPLLLKNGITEVLSVGPAFDTRFEKEIRYHSVHIDDISWADILQHFDETYTVISDAATSGGRILVHCVAGVSRSAAIIAAYLMKSQNLTRGEALAIVASARPIIAPNSGFMFQLKLYHAMNYTVDRSFPDYRLFRIRALARRKLGVSHVEAEEDAFRYGGVGTDSLATTASTATTEWVGSGSSAQTLATVIRCRKCRRVLQDGVNVMRHAGRCAFVHVEPMRWISGIDGDPDAEAAGDGRIVCPNTRCGAKLGSWCWAGAACSCGTWVWPSFALHASKIDEIRVTRQQF
ncbi:protein-tyrosine phosphatase-like protein [Geranomyces variabilis]|nr:protein-tyrosine phosphatase-like protein [Geranomyces variabilis]KAJ3138038.1 dual specificity phosphatase 12 [Geranomyces variabilis]